MIATILSVGLFWFIYWISMVAGFYISEFKVTPFGFFDVYPYKCRRCLSTQMMLALYASASIIISSWWFMGFGVVIAAAQAICFIITDKEKGL